MLKLDLDEITVDTFALQDVEPSYPGEIGGLTQDVECTVTLAGSCTCKCHTPRYDCV